MLLLHPAACEAATNEQELGPHEVRVVFGSTFIAE